jgi:LytS/YehU family sensor histidine kinase
MLRTVLVIGLSFDVIFCIVLGSSYLYRQWQNQWQEKEQMKRAALQHQFDQLKSQVNPHFLFNSLNSLTELIGEDQQQAETFVEELAKVYRYLLQTNKQQQLVPLRSELAFIRSYSYLLTVRYGAGIAFHIEVAPEYQESLLPLLTLQTLVDNSLKHNVVSAEQPLRIDIVNSPTGQLLVRNNRQPKKSSLPANQFNLADLNLSYQLAGADALTIDDTDGYFTVRLPLLPHDRVEPAPETR